MQDHPEFLSLMVLDLVRNDITCVHLLELDVQRPFFLILYPRLNLFACSNDRIPNLVKTCLKTKKRFVISFSPLKTFIFLKSPLTYFKDIMVSSIYDKKIRYLTYFSKISNVSNKIRRYISRLFKVNK